ncbi:hypothetical protein [Facklamia sp. P12955]|uniref:hypothetical protein n=1 Tax=unclassified Facklamia TaxID=2622293 RepID=UPI003D1814BE
MNLTYQAVKVGEMPLDKLNIESEFKIDDSVDGYLLAKEEMESDKDMVNVYDVILAGVSHD